MTTRIGRMRERVTIQQNSGTKGTRGQKAESWTDVKQVWAEVRMLSGTESQTANMNIASATHRVRIRWRSDVTEQMRLEWGTRYLGIVSSSNPDGKRQFLELLCEEAIDA